MHAAKLFDALVESFLTTVAKVEEMTGLEFGDAVSQADIRFGHQDGDAGDAEAIVPGMSDRRRPRRSAKKSAKRKRR